MVSSITHTGISIYPGLEISFTENYKYLIRAAQKGIRYVFMSLHIPEMQPTAWDEFQQLVRIANQLQLRVIVDISRAYWEQYPFFDLPIYALRLDFGFNDAEIRDIITAAPYKIALNASTIRPEVFNDWRFDSAVLKKIIMSHNFYLKPGSGLSYAQFVSQTEFYQQIGLDVFAFVKSNHHPRPPLKEGLVTIESHRQLDFSTQISELNMMGLEGILIGDALASDEEVEQLTSLTPGNYLMRLKIPKVDSLPFISETLAGKSLLLRPDQGAFIWRFDNFRLNQKWTKNFKRTKHLKPGLVTLDNELQPRYAGEIQIWLQNYRTKKPVCSILGFVDLSEWTLENRLKINSITFIVEKKGRINYGKKRS